MLNSTPNMLAILRVERAIADLRRGVPVRITAPGEVPILAAASETMSRGTLLPLVITTAEFLIIAASRVHYLEPQRETRDTALDLSKMDAKALLQYSGLDEHHGKLSAMDLYNPRLTNQMESAALKLAKHAELMPSAVVAMDAGKGDLWQEVSVADIETYQSNLATTLQPVINAPLHLRCHEKANITAFRSPAGGKDHYAIVVGEVGEAPLVRVHSSCYTGDLLGSISCDCGDQLQTSLEKMAEDPAGGILLYLQQEGRGIGLTNKLRCYRIQEEGADTVDANLILGFDDDERLFAPAATMLRHLNIPQVRLLTNNPRKATALEELGIHVAACVPHIMEAHDKTSAYMQTKRTRLGHKL
jgi:GTP cyclohydrolase II